uniref:Uncharacterized protein n=1 Tax=Parascaris univalens TaxID=6257 RepID=A0A915C2G3_PARUN
MKVPSSQNVSCETPLLLPRGDFPAPSSLDASTRLELYLRRGPTVILIESHHEDEPPESSKPILAVMFLMKKILVGAPETNVT